jgi:hypothetical protein
VRRVEKLSVDRDAAGLVTVETVNDHAADPSAAPGQREPVSTVWRRVDGSN